MHLLFVCSGNTCRSPLALAAWRALTRQAAQASSQRVARATAEMQSDESTDEVAAAPTFTKRAARLLAELEADSAGLCAHDGDMAATFACAIAREWGEDLETHRARLFRAPDAKVRLIVTMTESQADVLRAHFGLDEERVRVLGSYLPPPETHVCDQLTQMWGNDFVPTNVSQARDIIDPYGGSMEAYQECAGQVLRAVAALARSLATRK